MKILVVYATNTGNTYLAAQIIRDSLSSNHEVELVNALEAKPELINDFELILLGSSSWDWQGKEGHPIQSMINYLESLNIGVVKEKKFVMFGCGDKDFKLFCGAVDRMTDFVEIAGGEVVFEPLKVDKLYMDILHKIESVKEWSHQLREKLGEN